MGQRIVSLPLSEVFSYLDDMEVPFTPDQEAQLAQLARNTGKSGPAELLKDTALQLLDEDARFRAAVMEGKAYADRGEFIEEEEMDARLEEMLRS
jgi:predicted transcriptional regulator